MEIQRNVKKDKAAIQIQKSYDAAKNCIERYTRVMEKTRLFQIIGSMDFAKADEFIKACGMDHPDISKVAEGAWRGKMVTNLFKEAEAIANHFGLSSRESEAKKIVKRLAKIKKDISEDEAMFI